MDKKAIEILEYNKIKEILKTYALSDYAKDMIDNLEPYVDINYIERNIKETTEARAVVDISSSVPIANLSGIKLVVEKLSKDAVLLPEDLEIVASMLREIRKLKRFMKDKESVAPTISTFALSTYELDEVREEIERCICYSKVDDRASSKLAKTRKKINMLEDKIKDKLADFLTNNKNYCQDNLISQRNGRYVVPVKSGKKRSVDGVVHDKSSSGSTVFIEPAKVKKLQDELDLYKIDEEREVYRILAELTNLVYSHEREININIETMSYYDFIFAKGKYSKSIDGRSVKFNTENYINIKNGKHPLLGRGAVPLNFEIGDDYRAVVITGPNTGGKTVALKTVGLLAMMVQSGLHVPVDEDSQFSVFADVLADIGDGQSIEQNLSTFSSHITNIIDILNNADKYSLVIIDEVGSGTDPGEGMGIAVAVLEEIYKKGATLLATTHYNEIKEFAKEKEGFVNGCMEFDINTLKPLYRLKLGKPGESNAFLIALRLGMSDQLIERAHQVTYKEIKDYRSYKHEFNGIRKDNQESVMEHQKQIEKLNNVRKIHKISEKQNEESKFNIGDSVNVSYLNKRGIICELENDKGEYGVMIKKQKYYINHKRLSIYIKREELYPEDYDFDIIFESKEKRKKEKLMSKRHVEGLELEIKKGE